MKPSKVKIIAILLIAVLVLIVPAVSASHQITTIKNISWYGGSDCSFEGHVASNAIDGSTSTYAQCAGAASLEIFFDNSITISSIKAYNPDDNVVCGGRNFGYSNRYNYTGTRFGQMCVPLGTWVSDSDLAGWVIPKDTDSLVFGPGAGDGAWTKVGEIEIYGTEDTDVSYTYPVSVIDAISGSGLDSEVLVTLNNWNQQGFSTDPEGNYTVSSVLNETFENGDILLLEAIASGHETYGFSLNVNDDSNGKLQIIPLLPLNYAPKNGEFMVVFMPYDNQTGESLKVSATVSGNGYYQTKSDVFSPAFINLTAGDTYSYSISKTGYDNAVASFTGGNKQVVHINVPMYATGLTPPVTPTPTTTIPSVTTYFYPVTITDAKTGNAIAGSTFSSELLEDDPAWYNQTSGSGKFNCTGTGTTSERKLSLGDVLLWEGSASGYVVNGYQIEVQGDNVGVTQFINLAPISAVPKSGEFSAVVSVYDDDTTAAIYGAELTLTKGSLIKTKTTGTGGSAVFTNLTAGDTYTLQTVATGYTTSTKSFTGGSGYIVYVDVALSSIGINPTATTTATGTTFAGGNTSADALNSKASISLGEFLDLAGQLWPLGLLLLLMAAMKKGFGGK